jgi:sugar/nucleoside kinase (ribokinase family)
MEAGRIVVLGDVMNDVVVTLNGQIAYGTDTPARIVHRGGGAGANLAVWLARGGAPVTLIAAVGDDAAGAALRAELPEALLHVDAGRPTGTCVVLVDASGERTMLPDPGANEGLPVTPLPAGAAHVHVTGYALLRPGSRPAARALLAEAAAAGVPVSVGPSSAAPLAAVGADAFLGWAGLALLLANRDEVAVLGGAEDPEAAARGLGREVVVTLGAEGALWTDGRAVERVPAVAAEVVDTTGAGDAFAAGLLAARLAGAGPRAQLETGCRLAAQAVARAGAR